MRLDGLDLSGEVDRGEGDHHAGLDYTSFHVTHGHCSSVFDFVNILEGQPEGLVGESAEFVASCWNKGCRCNPCCNDGQQKEK